MSGLYGPETLSVIGGRDNIFIDTSLPPLEELHEHFNTAFR